MNHTENYHLPQWEKSDRVLMEDFNAAMSALDTGLDQAAQAAQAANAAADTAQIAADAAQTSADAAQATANAAYCPSLKPYVVGKYTGNGITPGDTQTIEVGFQPSAVFVCGEFSGSGPLALLAAGDHMSHYIARTSTGFTVRHFTSESYPRPNINSVPYHYIAFR